MNNEDSRVWIVVPTFNRPQQAIECIQDLLNQSYQNLSVVLVNDGQDCGLRAFCAENSRLVYLKGDGSLWWAGSMNAGLSHVMAHYESNDYVVSLNDDVRVDRTYIRALVDAMNRQPEYGMLGSVAVSSENRSTVLFCGNSTNWARGWLARPRKELPKRTGVEQSAILETDSLPGRGTITRAKILEAIGFYRAAEFPQYFADDDFSLRVKAAGWQVGVCESAVVVSHEKLTGIARQNFGFGGIYAIAGVDSLAKSNCQARSLRQKTLPAEVSD